MGYNVVNNSSANCQDNFGLSQHKDLLFKRFVIIYGSSTTNQAVRVNRKASMIPPYRANDGLHSGNALYWYNTYYK